MRSRGVIRATLFAVLATCFTTFSHPAAQAIGSGNCISTVTGATATSVQSGSNCIVIFTSGTGTWAIPSGVTSITYLVVGGGGGGSRGTCSTTYGPGGGGGAVLTGSLSVSGTVNVTVGSGGSQLAGSCPNTAGNPGNPSILASITANGGGAGGNGLTGGTSGNGNAGGTSPSGCGECYAGGGGGAGGVGGLNGNFQLNGGAGITSDLSGTSTAYGGGGGGRSATFFGTATAGGGTGNGTCTGTPNTGGGGADCFSAASGGSGGGAGGSGIVIAVYAYDNTPPTFTSSSTFSVDENLATSVNVATIRVSESATITISGGSDSARFTITFSDSQSANLRFAAIPNFESPADSGGDNIYNVNLLATDRVGLTGSQSITITVLDVNEAPIIGSLSGAISGTFSAAENSTTLYNLSATDVDAGSTLTYSLTGTDANNFSISNTGELTFSPAPDFEAPTDSDTNNTYIVITWVSDGSLSDSQTVTITVTNLNESGALLAPTLSGTPAKGIAITTSVSLNAAGSVRFFVNGKRIANCLARPTSGSGSTFTATCTWRPTFTGRQSLTATLTPASNTFSAATSPALSTFVVKRTTRR
jgi:VCBS repeat-containing protein